MPWFDAPRNLTIPAVIAAITVIVIGCAATGVAAEGPSQTSAVPSAATAAKPDFTLGIAGVVGNFSLRADQTSSLDQCTHAKDGSWRLIYGGGTPWISVDVLVVPDAGEAPTSGQVALEVDIPHGANMAYAWVDPWNLRSHELPGRSTASVAIRRSDATVSFDVKATTPDKDHHDTPMDVSMSIDCPI